MNKDLVIELADEIDILDPALRGIVADFLKKVFGYDIDDVLITDESEIWDFMTSVLPESIDIEDLSLEEVYGVAEQITKQRFRELYHIEVDPYDSLVSVAKNIQAAKVN